MLLVEINVHRGCAEESCTSVAWRWRDASKHPTAALEGATFPFPSDLQPRYVHAADTSPLSSITTEDHSRTKGGSRPLLNM